MGKVISGGFAHQQGRVVWPGRSGPKRFFTLKTNDGSKSVHFTDVDRSFEVRARLSDGGVPERVATSEKPLTFRAAAEFLTQWHGWVLPGTWITTTGLLGWEADMLVLCWTRWGEHHEWNLGLDLLSLTDTDLKVLSDEYGPFLDQGEEELINICGEIVQRRTQIGLENYSLGQLLDHFKIARGAGMLQRLMEALIAEGERRQGQIELFERDIEAAIDEVLKDVPPPKNRNAAVAIGMKVRPLREYIHRYLEKFGGVPEGKHQVDGEEVDFGRREVTVM